MFTAAFAASLAVIAIVTQDQSALRASPRDSAAQQAMLFPETSPLLDDLKSLDVNELSPIEALNKLFEWQKKYLK